MNVNLVNAAQGSGCSVLDYVRGRIGFWLGIDPALVSEGTLLNDYDPLVAASLEGDWGGAPRLAWKAGDPVGVILRQLEGYTPYDNEPPTTS